MTNCQGRILAIDDEPIVLDLIKYNLENEGYSVDISDSIEKANRSVDLSVYDLIITDVKIGKLSGIEFANNVKQNSKTSHIPIVICSDKDMKGEAINGLRSGADDYILKPFSMRELTARIQSILRRHSIKK